MTSPFTVAAPAGVAPLPAPSTSTFAPTSEQAHIRDLYLTRGSLAVEAGAGTGKTSTLKLLAESDGRRGLYVAFNKAIVTESEAKMPRNIRCSTAHSLAWRAIVQRSDSAWGHRLDAPRMPPVQLAEQLGIDPRGVAVEVDGKPRRVPAWRMARYVFDALDRFCQTDADSPSTENFDYLHGVDDPGAWTVNRQIRAAMLPVLHRAWEDAQDPAGRLPWNHSRYLKLWQLSRPCLHADVVLFDEAQDANPVLLDVIGRQAEYGSQIIWVGDSNQQIYEWTGAVNALGRVRTQHRAMLSQSWRFGDAIAEMANSVLELIDTDMRLTGNPGRGSTVAPVRRPDAILTRSNAAAIRELMTAQIAGLRPHLVGGGQELLRFARAAADLIDGMKVSHPDLACFETWDDVRQYVEDGGGDLALLVKMIEKFGTKSIIRALSYMPKEEDADLIISTAHKSKGREWDTVRLAGDFPDGHSEDGAPSIPDDSELRLLYVAVTRARLQLDVSDVGLLSDPPVSVFAA